MQNAELLGMPKIVLNKSQKNEQDEDIDILGVREEVVNASTMDLIVLDGDNDKSQAVVEVDEVSEQIRSVPQLVRNKPKKKGKRKKQIKKVAI